MENFSIILDAFQRCLRNVFAGDDSRIALEATTRIHIRSGIATTLSLRIDSRTPRSSTESNSLDRKWFNEIIEKMKRFERETTSIMDKFFTD